MDFGFLVDPHLVPDPWIYAEGIQEAVSELEQAAAQFTREPTAADSSSVEIAAAPAEGESPGTEGRDAPAAEALIEVDPLDLRLLMAELGKRGTSKGPTL